MPLSKEEFEEIINKHEKGSELLEFVTAALNAEKEHGVSETNRANRQSATFRGERDIFKGHLKKLGWDETQDVNEFIESLSSTKTEGTQSKTELDEVKKTLTKLQKEFEKGQLELKVERERAGELARQNKLKTIESKLQPKISEDFHGPEFVIKTLIADGKVDVDESGNIIFKNGDDSISFDEGYKQFKVDHKDSLKNKQAGGSGSFPGGSGAKVKYSREQLDAMTPEQAAKDITNYNESYKVHYSN